MTIQSNLKSVFDSNVLMAAHHHYYAPDICPAFWECMTHNFHAGRLLSIDRVRDEIESPTGLVLWVDSAPEGMFVSSGAQQVADAFTEVMAWVSGNPQYVLRGKEEFGRRADGWLVAYARVHNMVVVTNEVLDPNIKRRVPIPNVCRQFNVPYQNTFDMLRQLGARFVLDATT